MFEFEAPSTIKLAKTFLDLPAERKRAAARVERDEVGERWRLALSPMWDPVVRPVSTILARSARPGTRRTHLMFDSSAVPTDSRAPPR